jgi:hypothetical protein
VEVGARRIKERSFSMCLTNERETCMISCQHKSQKTPHLSRLKNQNKQRVARNPSCVGRGKWTIEQLKNAMDIMERGITFLRGVNNFFNIPPTSLFDHLNGKSKSKKVGLLSVLIEEEEVVVHWILEMEAYGLSIRP